MKNATINHYLKLVTDVEEKVQGACYYIYVGDKFIIEISKCEHNLEHKHDLMNVWKRHGYISERIPTHIYINTYYTDINGVCHGYYNVMNKLSDDRKRLIIDFDYLREWTEENIKELVAECIRMREMDICLK